MNTAPLKPEWSHALLLRFGAIALTLAFVVRTVTSEVDLDVFDRLAGIAVFGLLIISVEHHLRIRDHRPLPIVPLVALNFALTYAWPSMSDSPDWTELLTPGIGVLVLAAAASQLAGFRLAEVQWASRVKQFSGGPTDLSTGRFPLWIALTAVVMVRWTRLGTFNSTVSLVVETALPLVLMCLYAIHLKWGAGVVARVAFWAIVGFESARSVAGGQLAAPAFLVLRLTCVYYIYRRRVPVLLLAGATMVFTVLSAAKGVYRGFIGGTATSVSVSDALFFVQLGVEALPQMLSQDGGRDLAQSTVEGRVAAGMSALGVVFRDTPRIVPFDDGETLVPLITKPIPRFFWAEKPLENQGLTFGHRYGLLDPSDDGTSVNLAWPAELYMNFGWFGITFGSLVLGYFLGLLDLWLNDKRAGDFALAMAIAFLVMLTPQDANISMQIGGLLLTIPLYLVIGRALRFWEGDVPRASRRHKASALIGPALLHD